MAGETKSQSLGLPTADIESQIRDLRITKIQHTSISIETFHIISDWCSVLQIAQKQQNIS